MTKILKPLIILLIIMQAMVSLGFELAHDEAYYWLYSKNLAWGYFDHPPMVGIIVRAFSFLPHSEGSVRLGFIILQFLTLFFLFRLTEIKNHLIVTILFFSFPLASVAGILALPDMPLLFMTAMYCYFLKKFLQNDDLRTSFELAAVIALLLYSKYHGILLVFFTILALPKLFLNKKFYLVAVCAVLLFLPHVWWQYEHEFSTIRYHFLERPSSAFNVKRIFEYLGIQLFLPGLLAGPIVWWTAAKVKTSDDFTKSLKFISFGTLLFFLISSFTKKIEANWTIFLTIPLIILVADHELWKKRLFKNLLYVSFIIVVLTRLILIFPAESFGIRRVSEFHGWEQWAKKIKNECVGQIMANNYQLASKLSFYLDEEIHALNYHSRKNQFDYWRFDLAKPITKVCYVTDKLEFTGPVLVSPDGKELKVTMDYTYDQLLSMKRNVESGP